MYQRLSLACTLIHGPKLLLLDEPTVGIDPGLRKTFWEYFDQLTMQGKTVLITTHLMDEAEKCKVVGYMRKEGWPPKEARMRLSAWLVFARFLELWLKEPEKDAARLRIKGFEIQISRGVVQVRLENHDQIKRVLEEVAPLDMRLKEPKPGRGIPAAIGGGMKRPGLGRIYVVALRVVRQLKRDRRTIGLIVFAPIVLMVLFGYALSGDMSGVSLGLVDDGGHAALKSHLEAIQGLRYPLPGIAFGC